MANKNKHISHIKSNVPVNSYVSKTNSSVVITSEEYEALRSSEKENYILKAEPKLPSASDILYGEIAVNYKDDVETLSIKNDKDEIVEFASKKYVSKLVPTPTSLDTDKFLKGDGKWATPPSISYPKGTAQDLDTRTDTAEKVWDAKTIADYVQDTVNALPEPMVFKGTLGTDGTISSLPEASSSNEGFTYKVITDGTYAGQTAKIGDLFISNGTAWNLVPSGDEPSGTVTNVATGAGLTGGPITTSGTISHADTSSQASVSNSGRTYIQSVTLDGMGHVTGLSSATETVVNTDRYVNNAAFADDSASAPASPVKMTLTRAGSDTETVTANLPKVSSASAGVAPKGAAVTTQSQSTKFLREDGNWAAPSYTKPGGDVTGPSSSTDAHIAVFNGATGKVIKDSGFTIAKSVPSDAAFTDTQVTSAANHYAPAEDTSSQLDADASSTTAATWDSTSLVTGVTVKRDAKGHVVGLGVDSVKMPANPNTDIRATQRLNVNNGNYPILTSAVPIADTTQDITAITLRNNSIYANPSTGTITANKFNGSATHAETSSQSGSIAANVVMTSYWGKLWEIDVKRYWTNDRDVTFLLQSAYDSMQGTLHVKIRQEGANDSGAYKFVCSMRLTSGNIPRNRLRLYYNNSTGNCQLWYDCKVKYGVINAKMLHKTGRVGMELQSLGTLYNLNAAAEQTLPGTGYEYVEPTYAVITEWGNIQNRPSLGTADTLSTGISTTENTWSAAVLNAAIGTGATTATSVTNVPITNRVVVVTISSGGAGPFTFALDSGLTKGREVHVIVKNTGSSDYTIAIPHSPDATSGYKYINTVDNAQGNIVVPKESGGYVEINALYDGTYVYLRYA